MSIETLARLNPKTAKMDGVGGGNSDLTTSDISACLSGADKTGCYALMVKVCGDRSVQKPLFYRIYNIVVTMATKHGWKSPRGADRLRSLTQLAVFELVNDEVCEICDGSGYDPFKPTTKCKACAGTGRPIITDQLRASALGISPSAWSQTWYRRLEKIKLVIQDHEHKAIKKIYKQMKD